MNIFIIIWSYIKESPVGSFLNVVLLALGIAVITIVLQFENQIATKINDNAKGIDLVVGAKGSPLQLILCNIFHIDFPTGNISLKDAEFVAANRLVKATIPLALGDSYQGFRIVGTNHDYPAIYKAQISTGQWWKDDFEVTIGATVASSLGIQIGDSFSGSHGLSQGGDTHDSHQYVVKGILKKSNTIVDNLILCNIPSVWRMHDEEHHAEVSDKIPDISFEPSTLVAGANANDTTRQVTSLLLSYRSPMAAIQLPRFVNARSNLQAASPAFETARLFSIMGVGIELLEGFAVLLIVISALSLFIALYNSLKDRRYDLAIMRTMGANRFRLVFSILLEGSLLTISGSLLGIAFAHLTLALLPAFNAGVESFGLNGTTFLPAEALLVSGSLVLGILCSFIPAMEAYRIDISKTLADN